MGEPSVTKDVTFRTTALLPSIVDARFGDVTETSAELSWKTEVPTRSQISITDTRTGETREEEDQSYLKDHVYTLSDLDAANAYSVKIVSITEEGEISTSAQCHSALL